MSDEDGDLGPSTADRPGLGPWRSGAPPVGFEPFPDEALHGAVADRFLEVARRFPANVALSSPSGSWTYAELVDLVLERAAAIGRLLPDPPSAPRPVAILAEHDGPLVATILSVLVAGQIVVVLDPLVPADQQDHALAESTASIVLHDRDHDDQARELVERGGGIARAVAFDDLTGGADAYTPPARGPADAAMLAFTSGTSGSSRAAVVTNAVLVNLIRGATNALGIGPHDRMPMLFPTSLAVAAYPMLLPLLNGGTLATLDVRSVGLAPMADFLERERITVAYMAPTVVRFLVEALAGRSFPDIRLIALGGEVVDADAVGLTKDLFGPERVANGFGTTETGVITLYVLDAADVPEGPVPAGYPVPEVEVYVLDDQGLPVEAGRAGEVAISSPHVFAGYWGHPELSRQVLQPDPQGRPGWTLYRTGDLGSLDEDGALTVLGRLDTKVKVRGRFVVLGDVERRLHEMAGIRDAAVVATERNGVTELVAVLSAAEGTAIDPTDVRASLLEEEEAYRVPTRFHLVDALPNLPNGKVDRRALRELAETATSPVDAIEREYARHEGPERAKVRRQLRALWELLLPADVVGLDDDFFHLGGDSLVAAQMLVMAEPALGVTIPMGEMVRARTIRELAEVVLRLERDGEIAPAAVTCVQEGDETVRPRLWFVHDLQGSAFRVRHVAQALGPDQPVWSFESPLLRGEPNRFTSLDTFAARYVRDLRASQPEGPYWLAGYSFGGICAYEMARQLQRDGEEVAFVGVVDVGPGYRGPGWGDRHPPFRPWFGVAKPPPEGASMADKARHYVDMTKASPLGTARHLMVRSGLAERIDPIRFKSDLRTHGRVRPEWRLWYAWNEHWKLATSAWDRSNRFDGPIDLFWADDTASADATLGWDPLVTSVSIHRFAGDHMGILEPRGAPALARALRPVIDRAIEDRSRPSEPTP